MLSETRRLRTKPRLQADFSPTKSQEAKRQWCLGTGDSETGAQVLSEHGKGEEDIKGKGEPEWQEALRKHVYIKDENMSGMSTVRVRMMLASLLCVTRPRRGASAHLRRSRGEHASPG